MARKPRGLRASVSDWVRVMADLYRSISEPQPPIVTVEGSTAYFVWAAVDGATSYWLEVGVTHDTGDTFNENVGAVLTYALILAAGTYYARVRSYQNGTPGAWTDHQTVVVT